MHNAVIELTTAGSRGRCSNHCAMENVPFSETIFPIYRPLISIIGQDCVKAIGTHCLSANTVNTREVPIGFKSLFRRKKNVETVRRT